MVAGEAEGIIQINFVLSLTVHCAIMFIADWGVCARSIRRVGGYDEIINSRSVFGAVF